MSDDRYILVIADNSNEMSIALEYACARSKKQEEKLILQHLLNQLMFSLLKVFLK